MSSPLRGRAGPRHRGRKASRTTLGQSPGNLRNVTRRRLRHTARRALTVAALAFLTIPALSGAAFAQDIGDSYSPDPLTPLEAWIVYGGTIAVGFAVAIILTVLSSRGSGPSRYRPGGPWPHPEVWIGAPPAVAEDERPHVAAPGSGGASGTW